MKRTLHILFAAFAAMILLPAAMMAQDAEGIRYSITDGTLFIGGSGPMDDYETYGECPWYEDIALGGEESIEVTKIVIEEGITHIGDYAFEDAIEVTSVTLPSTLESIGMRAFAYMNSLSEITVPENVSSIDVYAFFYSLNLSSITVDEENDTYDSRDNCNAIIKTDENCLIIGCVTTNIPEGVTSIGPEAFWQVALTELTIPASVTYIGDYAFRECSSLTSITFLSMTAPELESADVFVGCEDLIIYVPAESDDYNDWAAQYGFSVSKNCSVPSVEIVDGEFDVADYAIGIKEVEELTYTRTLPNTLWNALYVPIEIPVASLSANYDVAYINDIHSSDDDQDGVIDAMEMEVIKIKEGTLNANYPYLIRAKSDAAKAVNLVLEDVELFPVRHRSIDCSSVFTDFTIWGTYEEIPAEDLTGRYAISTTGAWQELAEGTTLKPCRLYLMMGERGGSPVKVDAAAEIRIRVAGEDSGVTGGEATDIEEVGAADAEENVIFDLMGRRVAAPVKGQIYIVNGKKVLF